MASKVYVGDVGTIFQVNIGSDATGATTTELRVTKPSGVIATWVATINGTDSTQLDYTILDGSPAGDLDEVGPHKLQAYLINASGEWRGETVTFTVHAHFK